MRRAFIHLAAIAAGFVCTFSACRSSVDPNKGLFQCTRSSDCGDGWQCVGHFSGVAYCHKEGTCALNEVCNGLDDNCDGQVDEAFAENGESCSTGKAGICGPGTKQCVAGEVTCVAREQAKAESCNELDDDCDGTIDNGFDLVSNDQHCGACGHACPTGTRCQASQCAEAACDDRVDNDDSGVADCTDSACRGRSCGLNRNCGAIALLADGGQPDAGEDAGTLSFPADGGAANFCAPVELNCGDGLDDDLDALADCADPDCAAHACGDGGMCSAGTCR